MNETSKPTPSPERNEHSIREMVDAHVLQVCNHFMRRHARFKPRNEPPAQPLNENETGPHQATMPH
jgi:hypothetical protein